MTENLQALPILNNILPSTLGSSRAVPAGRPVGQPQDEKMRDGGAAYFARVYFRDVRPAGIPDPFEYYPSIDLGVVRVVVF